MHPYRTRFARDIVTEFFPPFRKTSRVKAVILCDGMPGLPPGKKKLEFWAKKGFWVFAPRYRGAWESGGSFLRHSPEKDIREVIDGIHEEFRETFGGKKFRLKPDRIYLVAGSFGGPAGMLLSKDTRVTKVLAISPIADTRDLIRNGETWDWTYRFTKDAFGEAYRFKKKDWDKQKNGKFYNPATNLAKIDGNKVLIMHAKDDDVIPYSPVVRLAKAAGIELWLFKKGGHCPDWFTKPRLYRKIARFFNS
jgi:pimeloyl-ACP methyl ester carboxylesterase